MLYGGICLKNIHNNTQNIAYLPVYEIGIAQCGILYVYLFSRNQILAERDENRG